MKAINAREIQNNLARHHFNLLSNVTALVDTSPPYSMYNSPKSIHYRPLIKKKAQSTDSLNQKGQTAQKPAQSQVSFSTANSHNVFATKSVATNQSLTLNKKVPKVSSKAYNKRLATVESKLVNSNCYQRAYKARNNLNKLKSESMSLFDSTESSQTVINNLNVSHQAQPEFKFDNLQTIRPETSTPKASSIQKVENYFFLNDKNHSKIEWESTTNEYQKFKEKALNRILLRRVFTTDAIKDCFKRQIEQNSHLNMEEMQKIMEETMLELGAKNLNDKTEVEKSTRIQSHSSSSGVSLSNVSEPLPLQKKQSQIKKTGFYYSTSMDDEPDEFSLDTLPPIQSMWDSSSDNDDYIEKLSGSKTSINIKN